MSARPQAGRLSCYGMIFKVGEGNSFPVKYYANFLGTNVEWGLIINTSLQYTSFPTPGRLRKFNISAIHNDFSLQYSI